MFSPRLADELNMGKLNVIKSKETIHSTSATSSLVLSLNNKDLDVNNNIHNEAYKRRKLN